MGTQDGGTDADGHVLAAAIRAVLARVDAHARRSGSTASAADTEGPTRPGDADAGADVRTKARTRAGKGGPSTGAADPHLPATGHATAAAAEPTPGPPALDALSACFGLSAFEREILLLTAAAELDPTTASRCAAASGDPTHTYPTFALALAALGDPHWSALTPVAPLRRWRLVELDDETRLTASRLRIDERILHFLAGSPYLDGRLHGLLRHDEAARLQAGDVLRQLGIAQAQVIGAAADRKADGVAGSGLHPVGHLAGDAPKVTRLPVRGAHLVHARGSHQRHAGRQHDPGDFFPGRTRRGGLTGRRCRIDRTHSSQYRRLANQ